MIDDQIVQLSAIQHIPDIFKKRTFSVAVNRIQQRCLLIGNQVGIIGYAFWNRKNIFK